MVVGLAGNDKAMIGTKSFDVTGEILQRCPSSKNRVIRSWW
ncbi:MAG: hypothetical protein ABIJ30_00655 [bacterium]